MRCPDAPVRFYDDGKSDLFRERERFFKALGKAEAGSRNACLFIALLHERLPGEIRQLIKLKARRYIEIRPELCVILQPVLVVGFYPVDAAVFEREKRHSPVYLVVILERPDLVVFAKSFLEIKRQLVIGLVAYPEDVHAVFVKFPAEISVVFRKIR